MSSIVVLLISFSLHAQRDGVNQAPDRDNTNTSYPSQGQAVDTLRQDSIPEFEMSLQERFEAVRFTADLNYFNFEKLDTTLDYFHHYLPVNHARFDHYFLGALGSPAYSFVPVFDREIQLNLGYDQFHSYQYKMDSIKIYRINAPYTKADYAFGVKNRQRFHIVHANRVKEHLMFGVDFRKLVDNGFYGRQNTNYSNMGAYAMWDNKKKNYKAVFRWLYNDLTVLQNGGSVSPTDTLSIFEASQLFRRENNPIFLTESRSDENNYAVSFQQYLNLGSKVRLYDQRKEEKDSVGFLQYVPVFRLTHEVQYRDELKTFEDAGNEIGSIIENTFTFNYDEDFIRLRQWENKIGIIQSGYFAKEDTVGILPFQFNAYAVHQWNAVRHPFYGDTIFNDLKIEGNFQKNQLRKGADDFWVDAAIGILGSQQGSIRLDANYKRTLFKDFGIHARYLFSRYEPDYWYKHYRSNFFNWENDFSPVTLNIFEASIFSEKLKATATYEGQFYTNRTVWLSGLQAGQFNGTIQRLKLKKNFALGWWRMDNQLTLQFETDEALSLPVAVANGSIYYADYWFKKNLQFQAGIDYYYTTNFFTPDYDPLLGRFIYQEEEQLRFAPLFDIFFNFKIRTANFFFKTEFINQGLFQRGYYTSRFYPQNDISLRGGISWAFYD